MFHMTLLVTIISKKIKIKIKVKIRVKMLIYLVWNSIIILMKWLNKLKIIKKTLKLILYAFNLLKKIKYGAKVN